MGEGAEKTSQLKIPDIKAFTPEANAERIRQMENAKRNDELTRSKSLAFKQEGDKQGIIDSQLATTNLLNNLDNFFVTGARESTVKGSNIIDNVLTTQGSPSLTKTSVDTGATDAMKQLNNKVQSGNPDQMKDAMNNIGKMFSSLPQGIQNFFKGLLGLLGINIGNNEKPELGKLIDPERLKNEEQRKILDSYGVKIEKVDDKTDKLTFLKDSIIKGEKTEKLTEPTDTTKPIIKKTIEINKDNSINLNNPNMKSIDIKENDSKDGFTLTVINKKDGSIDTYTVLSEKKPTEAKQV